MDIISQSSHEGREQGSESAKMFPTCTSPESSQGSKQMLQGGSTQSNDFMPRFPNTGCSRYPTSGCKRTAAVERPGHCPLSGVGGSQPSPRFPCSQASGYDSGTFQQTLLLKTGLFLPSGKSRNLRFPRTFYNFQSAKRQLH